MNLCVNKNAGVIRQGILRFEQILTFILDLYRK